MVKTLDIVICYGTDIHNLSGISKEDIKWTPTSLHLDDMLSSDS